MKAKLILTTKDRQTVQEVPFDRPTITIGRKPANNLAFNRPEISGTHAAFLFENNQYFVMDMGSTNGTLLNGAQLVANEKYALQDKDVVTISPYTIQFVMEEETYETMIEMSPPPQISPGKPSTGTKPDAAAPKLSTGTEEQRKDNFLRDAEPPPPPPPKPAVPQPPPPAPAPAPAKQEPQPKAVAPAPAPVAPKSAPLPEIPVKASSGVQDYIWLGLGGLLVLAAIALIVFIFVGL